MLIGSRRGEVVEMKYADATPLLRDGRAELAYPADPPAVTPSQTATIESAKAAPQSMQKPKNMQKQQKHAKT